jgi:uncharacterized protein (TIGR03437 family)
VVAQGGSVNPASAVTGEDGQVSFVWTPAGGAGNFLRLSVEGSAAPTAEAVAVGRPVFGENAVVNAASFQRGISPGGIATIFGSNLAEGQVLIDGTAARVFFAGDRQVNFAVPSTVSGATAGVVVRTPIGESAAAAIPVLRIQPGVFFDTATGRTAAIHRGERIFEVYATGLGPLAAEGSTQAATTASVGGMNAPVLFSGLAPGFVGLYQVNLRAPAGLPAGEQTLVLSAGGFTSNETKLLLP